MGHPSLKKSSKRMSCRTRYKIDKKVREHNRKKRREAKKHPKGARPNLVVAPNLCPFKEQAIEELNRAKAEEKEIFLQNLKDRQMEDQNTVPGSSSLQQFVNDANVKNVQYDISNKASDKDSEIARRLEKMENMTLAKEFKKVVAVADVILEVLDARDPLGTRCKVVEETVLKYPGKRLVIVVNKADLVPRNVLERWLTYLRGKWPTVPFKASIQQQSKNLGRRKMVKKSKKKKKLEHLMSVSCCVGGELLMKILANYRRNKGITTSITVGVVGMPNVGKSSVINSLKRSKSCAVGANPGITRNMQSVQIGTHIKILDSPGIVTETPQQENRTMLALKNVLRPDRLQDPTVAADAILQRASKEQMMQLYFVGEYSSTQDFLFLLSKRLGLLGKKGIPDTFKAAQTLVSDWNRGKIRYYTLPPDDNTDTHVSAAIVSEVAKEFDIATFELEEKNFLNAIEVIKENRVVYLDANMTKTHNSEPMDVDLLDTDKVNSNIVVDTSVPTKKSGKLRWRKKKTKEEIIENIVFNGMSKLKRRQKLEAKKKRKEQARKTRQTEVFLTDNLM